jgi:hypothetical protein
MHLILHLKINVNDIDNMKYTISYKLRQILLWLSVMLVFEK